MIRFEHYIVSMIDFEVNPQFNPKLNKGIQIDPKFTREHSKVDNDRLQIKLGVHIKCELFRLHIELSGLFFCENWESNDQAKEMLLTNTSAILFPYLRTIVQTTTMSANIPTYTIPVMNIVELFKKQ